MMAQSPDAVNDQCALEANLDEQFGFETLRFEALGAGWNLNWIRFSAEKHNDMELAGRLTQFDLEN